MKLTFKKSTVQKNGGKYRKKFLYYFPKGFRDAKYYDWERGYKLEAHFEFQKVLNKADYAELLEAKKYEDIAGKAVRIESKTNLLFSFEKMALRDAIKIPTGAKLFAEGLFEYVYGSNSLEQRFKNYVTIIASLPRKQTRVLTWPLLTVFPFLANPQQHIFLKPRVTQIAAEKYGFDFNYKSKPDWETYQSLLDFAALIKKDNADLKPQDFIDLQSFIWVIGSEEYPD